MIFALEYKFEAFTCAQDVIISGGAHTPSLCDANAWDPKHTQPQYAQPQVCAFIYLHSENDAHTAQESTAFWVCTKEGNIYQAKRHDRAGVIASRPVGRLQGPVIRLNFHPLIMIGPVDYSYLFLPIPSIER
jgi:hypothetical protein